MEQNVWSKAKQLFQRLLKSFHKPKPSFLFINLFVLAIIVFSATITFALTDNPAFRSLPLVSNLISFLTPSEDGTIQTEVILDEERPLDLPSKFLELIQKTVTPTSTPSPTKSSTQKTSPTPISIPTPITQPSFSQPQSTRGTLEVRITNEVGQSIPYPTFKLFLPDNQIWHYQCDSSGYKKVEDLTPGNYTIRAHYSTNHTDQNFSIRAGETTNLTVAVSTVIASPTPTPDTSPPVLDTINGPYDWHEQGLCFTIDGDQVYDNNPGPFSFAWRLDDSSWPGFVENETIKCYQNLAPGEHVVEAKVKDQANNESNSIRVFFLVE